ncbi:biotin synthase BioB [Wenjunlia tyrosinilytica]|uniref:Biotin synthase n=1 Tax=Wenjunlia tyrosinilytica TaxID=1544741 RepID=A0A917ZK21_9ACTN|nr:biotin synthase BioB [Wenjunlia tyrosinilytica]GGO84020.1 biotin synthase [Wenjunlia tyrosinilytica]
MDLLKTLVDKGLRRELPTREEALAVLAASDDEVLDVVAAASKVRTHWFGRRVKLNYLVNLKSGLCPEDCSYCSQRLGSKAEILKYTWLKPDEAAAAAKAGVSGGAKRVCLVASGRGPTDRDVERVSQTIEAIKQENGDVEICACLGLLSDGQADKLRAAGADAYNHNLNTSESTYGDICTTHDFSDRVSTVQQAQAAGLSACSGLIAGMGESDEDLVDVVYALRDLDPDSVPVNFLIPFEGTPLAKEWNLTPQRCLRILAMVRFVCPDVEVRIAGGREVHLRSMQPLALHLANSIFLGDYLTSEGQAGQADLAMIADAGFTVEGTDQVTLPEHRADVAGAGCGSGGGCAPCGGGEAEADEPAPEPVAASVGAAAVGPSRAGSGDGPRPELVAVRRRGAGTDLPPNA